MKYVYRINTGSCGGCDVEIESAIGMSANVQWASSPQDADVLLLTGPITHSTRAPLFALLRDVGPIPLLAIGRCAIDGYPFGKGGVQAVKELAVQAQLEGCPPTPEEIAVVIQKY